MSRTTENHIDNDETSLFRTLAPILGGSILALSGVVIETRQLIVGFNLLQTAIGLVAVGVGYNIAARAAHQK